MPTTGNTELLYGFKKAVLTQLNTATGLPPEADPKVVTIDTTQQAGFTPQFIEGQRTEQRGGDGLIGVIEETASFVGMDISFSDSALSGDAMEIIAGGVWDDVNKEYTPPRSSDKPKPFMLELYQARYKKGSSDASELIGYTQYVCYYVTGKVPSFTQQDRNFVTPQYTLKCKENNIADLPVFKIKDIAIVDLP